jgi:anti-anti-sigma factor
MAGVLLFDTLPGLFIGIGASLLLLLYRASRPYVAELGRVPDHPSQFGDLDRHPENETVPGVVVVRVESGLFFANVDTVRDRLKAVAARPEVRSVVIDAEAIAFIDVTAARMLAELAETLAETGVTLVVAHEIGQVRDLLHPSDSPDPGPLRVYPSVRQAVDDLADGASG